MKKLFLAIAIVFGFVFSQAQTITGTVTDQSGEPLPGATVVVEGTDNGVTTDFDGNFSIQANSGDILVVSFIGYSSQNITVSGDSSINVSLASGNLRLEEITVSSQIIDVAKDRETPIAVSAISAQEISAKIGNQEFPEIMNRTPGVYATKQGGGYGDSRISLRGFDQRNTSFLINGQPVNDMENGWVYWSNWQGLTEVASGIQIQRGLGASRLAVPSVGGTVSIFTKTAERTEGGSFNQLIGNDGYTKTSFIYNTGKNENGSASYYLLIKLSGDGYFYNTI
ncbi:MAG: carboxypeptidase-like regulatory domain-containing protein, partial [Flavobacteriaceae bacterium]